VRQLTRDLGNRPVNLGFLKHSALEQARDKWKEGVPVNPQNPDKAGVRQNLGWRPNNKKVVAVLTAKGRIAAVTYGTHTPV